MWLSVLLPIVRLGAVGSLTLFGMLAIMLAFEEWMDRSGRWRRTALVGVGCLCVASLLLVRW